MRVHRVLALGVVALAVLAAAAWAVDARVPGAGLTGRDDATAALLVLLAFAVAAAPGRPARAAGALLAAAAVAAAAGSLDVSRNALLCAGAVGAALVVHPRRHANALAAIAGGVAAVALVGRAAGVPVVAGGLSLPAAGALLLAATAVATRPPTAPAVALLVAQDLGGALARRLLPLAVLLPLALEGLRIAAVAGGVVAEGAADWLAATVLAGVFGWAVLRFAQRLGAADAARRQGLADLSAAERSARSVTETASDAIVQADAAGRVLAVNAAAERLFGRSAAALAGRPLSDLLPALGSRLPPSGAVELAGRHAAGHDFPVELSVATFDHDGETRCTAIIRDIRTRKAAEAGAAQDAARLRRALDAQLAIAGARDAAGIMELLAVRATASLGADGAVVALPDGDDLVHRAATGVAADRLGSREAVATTLAGAALASGEVQVCDDAVDDQRVPVRAASVRSVIALPLRHDGRVVAVLEVVHAEPAAFGERARQTLELLVGIAGGALARAQAEERLTAARAVAEAITVADDLERGLVSALRAMTRTLGWDAGVVWLAHERAERLECVATWQEDGVAAARWLDRCRAVPLLRGEGSVGHVWADGEAQWLDDLEPQQDDFRVSAAIEGGIRTIVYVPVVSDGAVIGALGLGSRARHTPDGERVDLLRALAAQLGQFSQRTRAERRVAEQASDLRATVELAHRLRRVEEPGQARQDLVRSVRAATRADAVVLLEREGTSPFSAAAHAGLETGDGSPELGPLLGRLVTGGSVLVEDLSAALPFVPSVGALGIRTALVHPTPGDAAALLVAWHDVRVEHAERVRSLMPLLAAEAGAALERADLLSALRASARTDQLTGLANRRAWDERLPDELARARRSGQPLAVAMLDLDHFKAYNDTHGHQDGDRLLQAAAAAWDARLRSTDLIARYGGEEFAVALPGCSPDAAGAVAEALRAAVPEGATCSIGVTMWDGEEPAEALVARADAALYEAKRTGRDRVVSADTCPAAFPAPAPAGAR